MPAAKKTARKKPVPPTKGTVPGESPSLAIPEDDMERLTRMSIILRYGTKKSKTLLVPFMDIVWTEASGNHILIKHGERAEYEIACKTAELATDIIDNLRFDKQDQIRDMPPLCEVKAFALVADPEGGVERVEL